MLQAIDGQGVALGRSVLVADDLALNRLMAPFDTRLTASYRYWFVVPESAAQRPACPPCATGCRPSSQTPASPEAHRCPRSVMPWHG